VSRRTRALGFLLAALFAAAGAAAVADGYGERVARGYGRLRPVLVASADLPAGKPLRPAAIAAELEIRRIPVRFTPPGALSAPAQAAGLEPIAPVPAGAYLLASQLRSHRTPRPAALAGGRRPVEIEVSGAGALMAFGSRSAGTRVDVVVTAEPSGSSSGRTYVAAPAVPLLALAPSLEGEADLATATLGLTRAQALRLIAAESFARRLTLIPR
jgi:Flp pilus assembly protein CpaB